MTREEAIKTLKENSCAMCAYCSKDMDSCDIRSCDNKDAIKVLEQESCEDAIKYFNDIYELSQTLGVSYDFIDERIKLEKLRPITPAEKVGQWEWEQEPFNKNWGNWHCSKCREIMTVCSTDWAEINKPNYKYCFNCGAKMQEEAEE